MQKISKHILRFLPVVVGVMMLASLVQPAQATTFTSAVVDKKGGANVDMVLNAANNPVLAYYSSVKKQVNLRLCTNTTCTKSTKKTVWSDVTSVTPVVALHDFAPVVVVGYEGKIRATVCSNDLCAETVNNTLSSYSDAMSSGQLDPKPAAMVNGDILTVTYLDGTALKLVSCQINADNTITCLSPIVVNTHYYAYTKAPLMIGTNGFPVVAIYSEYNQDTTHVRAIQLAECQDARCAEEETATVLDGTTDGLSGVVQVVATSTGLPEVLYYDIDADNHTIVHVLNCKDHACVTTVSSTIKQVNGKVINGIDFALTSDNKPVALISTQTSGQSQTKLSVVRCSDTICTETKQQPVVEGKNLGDVTLGLANNKAVVGYYNSHKTTLHVASQK